MRDKRRRRGFESPFGLAPNLEGHACGQPRRAINLPLFVDDGKNGASVLFSFAPPSKNFDENDLASTFDSDKNINNDGTGRA